MKKVGLLTYNHSPNLSKVDSFLVQPLHEIGIEGVPVPWDSPEEEWREYETLVIRSTWNYHKNIEKYLDWVQEVEEMGIRLHNPYKAIKWNYDKKYLHGLRDHGVNIIPTEYVFLGQSRFVSEIMQENNWNDVVVKPSVGASAYGIKHLSDVVEAQKTLDEILVNTGALVQPVMKSIYQGEWSLIYFNGKFSHSALKTPGPESIFVNSMYYGNWKHATPNIKLIKTGEEIYTLSKELAGVDELLYARVDGVVENGTFNLMEIELIEPGLYLNTDGAQNFAAAINEILS